MHRLTITYDLKRRGVALAGLAALTTFILGPWAALIAIGVLIATRNVTITWPAEQAPAQEQAPVAEEVSR